MEVELSLGERPVLGSAHAAVEVKQEHGGTPPGALYNPPNVRDTSLTTGKIFGTFGTTPPEPACAVHWGRTNIFCLALNDALNAQVVLISGCHTCVSVSAAIPGVP